MLDSLVELSAGELLALVVAGAVGLFIHYLGKLLELRGTTHSLSMRTYYLDHKPEVSMSVLLVYLAIYWTIESGQASLLNAVLLGYSCDSLANKFRNRAGNLTSKIG